MSTKYPNKTINYETTQYSGGSVTGVINAYAALVSVPTVTAPTAAVIDLLNFVNPNSVSTFRLRMNSTTISGSVFELRFTSASVDLFINNTVVSTTSLTTAGTYTVYPGISVISDGTVVKCVTIVDFPIQDGVSSIDWYNTSVNLFTVTSIITTRTQ